MALEFRLAKPSDLKALLPLVEAFAREQQNQLGVNVLTENFMEFARSGIAQALDHPAACVMLAEETGPGKPAIVGYAVGMVHEPPSVFQPEMYTFLSDLFVLEERRRSGIGSALLERVRGWGWVKGISRLSAAVPSDSAAQRLLEKAGFRPLQTMMYYKDEQ